MNNNIISGFACFSLKVEVATFPSSHKHELLILESDPEPGYFSQGNFPQNLARNSDHHFYLVAKKPVSCFQEIIMKHAFYVKNKLQLNLHVGPGQMTFQNEVYPCVRIRTTEMDQFATFLKDLKKLNIEFFHHKLFQEVKPYVSLVQYKKYIEFKPIDDGIYADINDKNRHFIELTEDIEFDEFETMIENIKNNCNFNMFNASLVYLLQKERILHLVAVYSKHCDEGRLPEFRDFLKKEMTEDVEG